MIKYLGSKRTLLADLVELLDGSSEGHTSVLDVFSGTSRVGHAFKQAGYRVEANDHNAYAHTLAQCYVEADLEDVESDAEKLIAEFNVMPGAPGYFTDTFCKQSRFFQPKNGERVDAIREALEKKGLPPILKSVLLVSLMEAADRVDSTCGVQMAFVKKWAQRSHNDLSLRMPKVLPRVAHGTCRAHQLEAHDVADQVETDVAYIDPPYNQHSYLGNYHIWESLVLWDKPEFYGIACKRVDVRTRKSDYNSKRRHHAAFADLIGRVRAKKMIVSFSNEGYQSREELESVLTTRGPVEVLTRDFKRYVGAQIGIHNPSGEKVGKVSHLRNEELIFVVDVRHPPSQPALPNVSRVRDVSN